MPELNNRPIVKYLDPKTGKYEYATVIDVGDLQLLNTQVKSDLVQAINSLFYDDRIGGGGSGELTPEDLERLKNIQASIDSIKDGTFEIVNFGSINTYLNQEMNAKYEELVERLNESNREMYDTSLIDIQAAVDAATLAYEQKVSEQNALLDGAEKTLSDTKLALEEAAKQLETADINYKSVKQTVDELNTYIENEIKVIDMDNFNSMVSDYKTAVQQTKDRYGVDASKQTLSYLTGQVADTQAQLNIQAGEIELRAKTDQLQYIPAKKESNANPNLLFETIELLSSHWNREYGAMVTPNTFRYGKIGEFTSTNSKFTTVSDTLEIGETYTLSLYTNEQPLSKAPTDEKFAPTDGSFTPDDLTVIVDGKVVTMAIFEDLSSVNGWCGVSGQFVATKENATINILSSGLEQTTHVGYISQPKLEKGLKVTPFISHVDDEIATVSTAFSLIKTQGDTILLQSQRVSKIGEDNDALKETVAGIQIESGKITTAVSELEKKTDDEISRVEGKIETEANRIALNVSNKTTDEKLSKLNMDTRNRIVNSDFELSEYIEKTKNWNYHGWSTIVSGIFTVLKLDSTNYLIADKTTTSSNLNNSIWMRSAPFEIQTGKKMNVQAEVFIASNPNNYQVIEIELFDNNNTLLSTIPINVSQYTSNVLRTVNLNNVPYNVFRVNFSTQIETEGVFKAQLKLGLRSGRGKVGFTRIMLNTSNMSEIDWAPAEEDNRIVQTKLESKIEILEDSISLMSEDERLDVLSGLLVQESGTFKISPQSILQEVTSAELGDSALVTKTFMNQTADGWKQGLVSEDGIIQAINASAEEYLIAFDKVRVDGSLEAKHFMGNALTLSDGFKIADKNGNAVLMANNDGQVVMNISQLEINAMPVATESSVDEKIKNIELTPGPQGVGIKSTAIHYAKSTSGTSHSGAAWLTTVPSIPNGQYLWTRTTWTYDDNTTEVGYSVAKMGDTGVKGDNAYSHVMYADITRTEVAIDKTKFTTDGTAYTQQITLEKNTLYEVVTNFPKRTDGYYDTWAYTTGVNNSATNGFGSEIPRYINTEGYGYIKISIRNANFPDYESGKYYIKLNKITPTGLTKIAGKDLMGFYSDNNPTDSTDHTKYTWTVIKGVDGVPGKDGIGIKSTVVSYVGSTNGTTAPTSGWTSTVPTVAPGNYLWTKTVWTYTDLTQETGYSVSRIGKDGNTGKDGIAGKDGVGIAKTTITYAKSTSGTTAPTTGYTTTVPSANPGEFVWTKTVWTYTDNTTETGYSVGKIGNTGANGAQGIPGKPGADGRTPYFHTAYANEGSNLVEPSDVRAWGTTGNTLQKDGNVYTLIATANLSGLSINSSLFTVNNIYTLKFNIQVTNGSLATFGGHSIAYQQLDYRIDGKSPTGIDYTNAYTGHPFNDGNVHEVIYKFKYIGGTGDTALYIQPNRASSNRAETHTVVISNLKIAANDGVTDFSVTDSTNRKLIGTFSDYTLADSTNPLDYKWADMTGDIQVGGVNLIKNSVTPEHSANAMRVLVNDIDTPFGVKNIYKYKRGTSAHLVRMANAFDKELFDGKSLTFSVYAKTVLDTTSAKLMMDIGDKSPTAIHNVTDKWQQFSVTTQISKDQPYNFLDLAIQVPDVEVYMAFWQLEVGTIPTTWKEAPEDIDSRFNNLTTGGRNLILDSATRKLNPYQGSTFNYTENVSVPEWNATDAINVKGKSGTNTLFATLSTGRPSATDPDAAIIPNIPYVYSIYLKNNGTTIIDVNSNGNVGMDSVIPGESKRIVLSGVRTITNLSYNQFTLSTTIGASIDFTYWHPQIEKGNIVSDWSQAPEDVQSSIDEKADAKATEDALNEAVQRLQTLDQEIKAAALDGELKDFVAKYNREQEALAAEKLESNSNLASAIESISLITNTMNSMSETWNFVDRFIKNSPEGIIVGDNNGGSYILLKEDRLSFYSNNEEVAYIAQNLMQISRGAFVEQIQISQYIFEEYGTNQLAVRYVGK